MMRVTDSCVTIYTLAALAAQPQMKVNTYRLRVRQDFEEGSSDPFQGIISMFSPF